MNLNWLDYVLIAVLLFSAAASFRRGFAREVVGLFASIAALILGMWFYGTAGVLVAPFTGPGHLANLVGFLIVVAVVLVCGALVGWIISRFVRAIGLSFFDRLLGAGFGLVRAIFILAALLTAFLSFGSPVDRKSPPAAPPEAMVHSQIAPYLLDVSSAFVALAPMELKVGFQQQYDRVRAALKSNAPRS